MAEFDFSSYPKPQSSNPMDAITKLGPVLDVLGKIEQGKAVQGAIQPDGSVDRNSVAQALSRTVAGGAQAIPTLDAVEKLRQAGYASDQSGLDSFSKRMSITNHLFGQLAAMDNPSIKDVNSIAARVLDPALEGHKYGLTWPVVMNALKQFRGPDGRPLSAAEIRKKAQLLQLQAASTQEQLEQITPQFDINDDGNTIRLIPKGSKALPEPYAVTKRIPTGTPTIDPNTRQRVLTPPQETAPVERGGRVTAGSDYEVDSWGRRIPNSGGASGSAAASPGASFQERFGARMQGAPQQGFAPGVAEAATRTAENSATIFNNITTAAAEVPAIKGVLDNLERELRNFTPGPGADWRRIGKAFANTVIPDSLKDKIGFDPKSIADQEGFNKLAYNLAQSQFQALGGTGTDAKLNSTMSTSPSELLSKEGNEGIIRLLKGNNDALKIRASEANKWRKKYGEDSAADFIDSFNNEYNPRIFQFKYVPRKDRQAWFDAMSPEEKTEFARAARIAKERGWIKASDL